MLNRLDAIEIAEMFAEYQLEPWDWLPNGMVASAIYNSQQGRDRAVSAADAIGNAKYQHLKSVDPWENNSLD